MTDILYMFVALFLFITVMGIVGAVLVLERLNDKRSIQHGGCDCHRRKTRIWHGWL